MSAVTTAAAETQRDREQTLRNRMRLRANRNLLYWYEQLYRRQFKDFPDPDALAVLEIGSGTSPLKLFRPNVITSDVLPLDYLDIVFDCHEIDKLEAMPDESLDVITLTNVLHHLRSPIDFLNRAAVKLKAGGKVIATEPFFSTVSALIFKYLHHEPVAMQIDQPELQQVRGPLGSANIALPWLIFFRKPEWLARLAAAFDLEATSIEFFSGISYMLTGGISRRLPLPHLVYRSFFAVDLAISQRWPRLWASFFTVRLTRR